MERSIIFSFFQLLHYPHYSCTAETLIAGYMLLISRIDLENCFGTWPCLFRRYNHPFHSPSFTRPQPFSPLFFGLSANFCQHYFKKKKKKSFVWIIVLVDLPTFLFSPYEISHYFTSLSHSLFLLQGHGDC